MSVKKFLKNGTDQRKLCTMVLNSLPSIVWCDLSFQNLLSQPFLFSKWEFDHILRDKLGKSATGIITINELSYAPHKVIVHMEFPFFYPSHSLHSPPSLQIRYSTKVGVVAVEHANPSFSHTSHSFLLSPRLLSLTPVTQLSLPNLHSFFLSHLSQSHGSHFLIYSNHQLEKWWKFEENWAVLDHSSILFQMSWKITYIQ